VISVFSAGNECLHHVWWLIYSVIRGVDCNERWTKAELFYTYCVNYIVSESKWKPLELVPNFQHSEHELVRVLKTLHWVTHASCLSVHVPKKSPKRSIFFDSQRLIILFFLKLYYPMSFLISSWGKNCLLTNKNVYLMFQVHPHRSACVPSGIHNMRSDPTYRWLPEATRSDSTYRWLQAPSADLF
jgi:hypothetical protein